MKCHDCEAEMKYIKEDYKRQDKTKNILCEEVWGCVKCGKVIRVPVPWERKQ